MSENNTASYDYFEEISAGSDSFLRRLLPVQLPYKLNVGLLVQGRVLEIGCGLGRNLQHFDNGAVGLDHNPFSVAYCQNLGLDARFLDSSPNASIPLEAGDAFDTLVCAHVLEHVEHENQVALLETFLPHIVKGGRMILITPQEKGHASTTSHITWTDFARLREIVDALSRKVEVRREYSFPLPRSVGKLFTHNEFVLMCHVM